MFVLNKLPLLKKKKWLTLQSITSSSRSFCVSKIESIFNPASRLTHHSHGVLIQIARLIESDKPLEHSDCLFERRLWNQIRRTHWLVHPAVLLQIALLGENGSDLACLFPRDQLKEELVAKRFSCITCGDYGDLSFQCFCLGLRLWKDFNIKQLIDIFSQ